MNNERYKKEADLLRSKLERGSNSIRSNKDLTEGAKAEKLKALRLDIESQMQALREQRKAEMQTEIAAHRSFFFTLRDVPDESQASKALRQSLYQQAIEKAEKTADDKELQDLLDIAQQTGNQLLAQAVGYVSFETQYFDIARAALVTNSGREKKFDSLMDLKLNLEDPTYRHMMTESELFVL